MAYRVLEVTIQSARDLKRVNLLSRMEVYAVVTISGDPLTRQCTPPDPYGGRHPCWNSTFRFNVPPSASSASGCLHVLLRTERALGDRDVGEVIVPLADVLAGAAGPQPQQCASYQVRKVHRCEPRGRLNVSFRLGPVVGPPPPQQQPARGGDEHVVAYPVAARPPFYHPSPYAYLPPTMSLPPPAHTQAAAGGYEYEYDYDGAHKHYSPSSAGPTNTNAAYNNNFVPASAYSSQAAAGGGGGGYDAARQPAAASAYSQQPAPTNNTYNNPAPAASAYSQQASAGYAPATKGNNKQGDDKVDFGMGLGAGLVSGAIGGMLASDMMAEAAAYTYGYRAGLADGGGAAAAYKNSHVPNKVLDKVESKRTRV